MQATSSSTNNVLSASNYGECRCCLSLGLHTRAFGKAEHEILMENLNLFLLADPRLPHLLCSSCFASLEEVQRFRQTVMRSETTLLRTITQEIKLNPHTVAQNNVPEIEVGIKPEIDAVVGLKTEIDLEVEVKTEIDPDVEVKTEIDPDVEVKTEIDPDDEPLKELTCEEPQKLQVQPHSIIYVEPKGLLSVGQNIKGYVMVPQSSKISKATPNNQELNKELNTVPQNANTLLIAQNSTEINVPQSYKQLRNLLSRNGMELEVVPQHSKDAVPLISNNLSPKVQFKMVPKRSEELTVSKVIKKVKGRQNSKMLYFHNKLTQNNKMARLAPKPGTETIPEFSFTDAQANPPQTLFPMEYKQLILKKVSPYNAGSQTDNNVRKDLLPVNLLETITIGGKERNATDFTRIRVNLILIIQNSTILPFRYTKDHCFKCFYCDETGSEFKIIRQHTEVVHEAGDTDGYIFKLLQTRQHKKIHADISNTKCKICNEIFENIDDLVKHLTGEHKKTYYTLKKESKGPPHGVLGYHLNTDNLKCHLCEKEFDFIGHLSSHMSEHCDKGADCPDCGKTYESTLAMLTHRYNMHIYRNRTTKCPECSEKFLPKQAQQKYDHMVKVHGIKTSVLQGDFEPRGKTYLTKNSNRPTHVRGSELICGICGYNTKCRNIMKRHIDFHNKGKIFECDYCKKKFGTKESLTVHIKRHTKDKIR